MGFGRSLQYLHKMFHLSSSLPSSGITDEANSGHELTAVNFPEKTSPTITVSHSTAHSYDSDLLPEKERVWSLLERYRISESLSPLTAHALVNRCVRTNHNPLPTLALPKEDIEDKIKADGLLKSIAPGRVSWFLMSTIVRTAGKLPIGQLEVCAAAFTIFAVATYMANWPKPKDVGIAIKFKILADTYECEAYNYHAEPFSIGLLSRREDFYSAGLLGFETTSSVWKDSCLQWQSPWPYSLPFMAVFIAWLGISNFLRKLSS